MQLHPEAQVRAVGAVRLIASSYSMCGIGLGISTPRISFQIRRSSPSMTRDDVLAVDEAHLDVELRELGLAVGARVFVAEAADDLHVLVAPADHQELLEELRRLRQRVEAARHRAATGTMKSRAPSGVLLVRNGVSISQNPRSPR